MKSQFNLTMSKNIKNTHNRDDSPETSSGEESESSAFSDITIFYLLYLA